jgi:hypothetical protein
MSVPCILPKRLDSACIWMSWVWVVTLSLHLIITMEQFKLKTHSTLLGILPDFDLFVGGNQVISQYSTTSTHTFLTNLERSDTQRFIYVGGSMFTCAKVSTICIKPLGHRKLSLIVNLLLSPLDHGENNFCSTDTQTDGRAESRLIK